MINHLIEIESQMNLILNRIESNLKSMKNIYPKSKIINGKYHESLLNSLNKQSDVDRNFNARNVSSALCNKNKNFYSNQIIHLNNENLSDLHICNRDVYLKIFNQNFLSII